MAGGGDTVAALRQFGFAEKMNYVSTGGGAFLELIEKGSLPALDILEEESLKEEQA
jgi:phosphoglycerate kinase